VERLHYHCEGFDVMCAIVEDADGHDGDCGKTGVIFCKMWNVIH
jgi:hypothetical protein